MASPIQPGSLPAKLPKKLLEDRPYSVVGEQESDGEHGLADVLTVFLTASTCPIGCTMCDLHRFTVPGPVQEGMIPQQIRHALNSDSNPLSKHPSQSLSTRGAWIKLYNSGNFFDSNSIPPKDYGEIGQLVDGFDRVVVENHPRFGGRRLTEFRDSIPGRLEIAVGLETVQPRWLSRMQKQMTRDDFDAYARKLRDADVDLRVFLIVGMPGSSAKESVRWTQLSIRHAVRQGARHVSLIPVRYGNGWGNHQAAIPHLTPLVMEELQRSAIDDHANQCVITVDLWDMSSAFHQAQDAKAQLNSTLHETIDQMQASVERMENVNRTQSIG